MLAATLVVAACDTGDGRDLQPTVVPTPAPTVATTIEGQIVETAAPPVPEEFRLVAPWTNDSTIDPRYTCDGDGFSPALSWVGVPDGTIELALAVVDDNADGFVHWVAWGIDPASISLIEDVAPGSLEEGINGFGDLGWGGPCPPEGDGEHVYRFTLYALGQPATIEQGMPAGGVIATFEGAALKSTTLIGRYSR